METTAMPWTGIAESHGFWGFLGAVVTAIGFLSLGTWKVLTGKEAGFRNDLLQRIEKLEKDLEEQRQYYERMLGAQHQRHREDIKAIREEYKR